MPSPDSPEERVQPDAADLPPAPPAPPEAVVRPAPWATPPAREGRNVHSVPPEQHTMHDVPEAEAEAAEPWAESVAALRAPEAEPAPRFPEPLTTPVAVAKRRRTPVLVGALVATLAIGGTALALTGGEDSSATTTSNALVSQTAPNIEGIPDDNEGLGALPQARPKLVQPVAGETSQDPTADLPTAPADDGTTPKVTGPASRSTRSDVAGDPGVSGLKSHTATALPNGVALPPLEAPEAVLDVIRAGNIIARTPYKWGGGHGNFQDNGYDCSGSVTYALYFAGLIDGSHTSGELMAYGKPGPGKWITIYTNPGHVYMEVAGVRFDTSGARDSGSRWQAPSGNRGGYEVRHPAGY